MKVQVLVKNTGKAAAADITVDATVRPADTANTVKELVASMTNTFSFPDQKLSFNGKVISTEQRLSEYGIKEGDQLEFSFQASEKTIVQQLSDLLGKRAMSSEELGLLYSYRFAVSVEDALKALGISECKLKDFLESQKCFAFDGGFVKITDVAEKVSPTSACLRPIEENTPHGPIEVRVSVEINLAGKTLRSTAVDDELGSLRLEAFDTVARAKEVIAASEQVPFTQREIVLGGKKLKDDVSIHDAGVRDGDLLVLLVFASEESLASQLEELVRQRKGLSLTDLGLLYCQRFGIPVSHALRMLQLPCSLRRFLEGQPRFSMVGGCVTLVNGPKLILPQEIQEQQDASAFEQVVDLLFQGSFLNIERVDKEKGAGGESVALVYINGLPPSFQPSFLQGLQKAVVFGLESLLATSFGMCSVATAGDAVEVRVEGAKPICIHLAAAPTTQ